MLNFKLSHLTHDLSQAQKQIDDVTSWANAQNEKLFHSKWLKLSFWVKIVVILSVAHLVTTIVFLSAWDESRVKQDIPEIQHRKWGPNSDVANIFRIYVNILSFRFSISYGNKTETLKDANLIFKTLKQLFKVKWKSLCKLIDLISTTYLHQGSTEDVNFIIQKLKNKHTFLKKLPNWAKLRIFILTFWALDLWLKDKAFAKCLNSKI